MSKIKFLAFFLILASCVSSQSVEDSKTPELSQELSSCDLKDDEVKLALYGSCYIDLKSNRATGYYWSISSSNNSKLPFSEEYLSEKLCMGCPETLRITITKKSEGQHKLFMILRPPARNADPANIQ